MEMIVNKNNKGFTLVEVLISMLILTIVLLMVVQSLALYMRQNVENLVRDEAVKIAQECVEDLRNGIDCNSNETRNFRNFSVTFNITAPSVSSFTSSGNYQVQISVNYTYPPNSNSTKTYTINTVVHKP